MNQRSRQVIREKPAIWLKPRRKRKAHALWTCAKKAKRMRNQLNGTSYFISRSRKTPQACGLPSILRDAPQLGRQEPSMPSRRDGGIPSRLLPERA